MNLPRLDIRHLRSHALDLVSLWIKSDGRVSPRGIETGNPAAG
jgi:hypothetical protein